MPLKAQKAMVDGWVGGRLAAFRDKQDAWLAARGEYFQGLATHSAAPADGAQVAPDRLGARPTDRPHDWTTFLGAPPPIVLPPAMPAALTFNVYEGSLGWGWELVAEFVYEGKTYRKVWNTGLESWRNADWFEVTEVSP